MVNEFNGVACRDDVVGTDAASVDERVRLRLDGENRFDERPGVGHRQASQRQRLCARAVDHFHVVSGISRREFESQEFFHNPPCAASPSGMHADRMRAVGIGA